MSDRPGHESGPAVEAALDEIAGALGFVVGKKAGAPSGSSVTYRLTGDDRARLHVAVDGQGGARRLAAGARRRVTLTMPVGVFTRLAAGGSRADEARAGIDVDGDEELAARLIDNSAFTSDVEKPWRRAPRLGTLSATGGRRWSSTMNDGKRRTPEVVGR